jgi:hypothetical protein
MFEFALLPGAAAKLVRLAAPCPRLNDVAAARLIADIMSLPDGDHRLSGRPEMSSILKTNWLRPEAALGFSWSAPCAPCRGGGVRN